MMKMRVLVVTLSLTSLVCADPSEKGVDEDTYVQDVTQLGTRAPLEIKKSMTFVSRCAKLAKGFGMGGFSALCGSLCLSCARKENLSSKVDFIQKVGAIGVSLFALVIAAETGSTSIKNFQEALT